MNPLDILNFLRPEFSDLLQASFFGVMLTMLLLTVISVSITASDIVTGKQIGRAHV